MIASIHYQHADDDSAILISKPSKGKQKTLTVLLPVVSFPLHYRGGRQGSDSGLLWLRRRSLSLWDSRVIPSRRLGFLI